MKIDVDGNVINEGFPDIAVDDEGDFTIQLIKQGGELIVSFDEDTYYLGKSQVINLIKGLSYTIDNGWFDKGDVNGN